MRCIRSALVALEMDTEDGVIWVYGIGDDGVLAFTDFGIETLVELIEIHKDLKARAGAGGGVGQPPSYRDRAASLSDARVAPADKICDATGARAPH
ncbi:hypothetical protein A1351_19745 [Methylosinus sp. R-45379]|nr:hypothetical protein A1351_19745 [Methylosinus sp. R-45379]